MLRAFFFWKQNHISVASESVALTIFATPTALNVHAATNRTSISPTLLHLIWQRPLKIFQMATVTFEVQLEFQTHGFTMIKNNFSELPIDPPTSSPVVSFCAFQACAHLAGKCSSVALHCYMNNGGAILINTSYHVTLSNTAIPEINNKKHYTKFCNTCAICAFSPVGRNSPFTSAKHLFCFGASREEEP